VQSEGQGLRNQFERLQNENLQLKQAARDQYTDLDSRIERIEGGSSSGGSPSAVAAPSAPASNKRPPPVAGATSPGGPRPAPLDTGEDPYRRAFEALKRDDFVESSRAFQEFVREYPNSPLAPNAWYWLGESYYVTQNYELALKAFITVELGFPDSAKVPDARLKKGYCQIEMGHVEDGAATLNALIRDFPGTEPARFAATKLRTLSLSR